MFLAHKSNKGKWKGTVFAESFAFVADTYTEGGSQSATVPGKPRGSMSKYIYIIANVQTLYTSDGKDSRKLAKTNDKSNTRITTTSNNNSNNNNHTK